MVGPRQVIRSATSLLLAAFTLSLAGQAAAELITNAPVFFGYKSQGEGIYLGNVQQPNSTNDPHIVIKGISTNLNITLTVLNGYSNEVFLLCDEEDCRALTIDSGSAKYYAKSGQELEPDVRTFGELQRCVFPGWISQRYQRLPAIESHHDGKMAILGGAETARSLRRTICPPSGTVRIDLPLEVGLEYYILGKTNLYRMTTELRVRMIETGPADAAK